MAEIIWKTWWPSNKRNQNNFWQHFQYNEWLALWCHLDFLVEGWSQLTNGTIGKRIYIASYLIWIKTNFRNNIGQFMIFKEKLFLQFKKEIFKPKMVGFWPNLTQNVHKNGKKNCSPKIGILQPKIENKIFVRKSNYFSKFLMKKEIQPPQHPKLIPILLNSAFI